MTAELQSTSHGQTLVLTLRAPEARNALDGAICAAGIEALGVAERSDEVRSVVITGADGFFSAETSLERLQARRQQPAQAQAQSVELLHHWVEAVRTHTKPVIAAVEGLAEGAGFSLALACDLVVAARNAAFAMGGARLGLSPAGGASWSLPQSLARQMASEILLCGEHIAAPRLHALGLVNHLAEPGRALHEAPERARAQRAGQHQGTGGRRAAAQLHRAAGARARPPGAQPAARECRGRHCRGARKTHPELQIT